MSVPLVFMDYFAYYQLPISFEPDTAALRRAFLQKSKQFHPDFHTLADAERQAEALRQSALNNEAWATLSDPDRRMRYILGLKGMLGDETQQTVPQEFLLEVMTLNEALMELEFEPNPQRHTQTLAAVAALEESLWGEVQPILATWTDTPESTAALGKVREYYLKKRYLARLREKLTATAA